MTKHRKVKKSKAKVAKRKIKRVKLTPDTIVEVKVSKGIVPLVATDPDKGVVIMPVEQAKIKERSWIDRLLGR